MLLLLLLLLEAAADALFENQSALSAYTALFSVISAVCPRAVSKNIEYLRVAGCAEVIQRIGHR